MDKVFCDDCVYFRSFHYCGGGYDDCKADGNKRWEENWQGRYYSLIRKPWKINKYNDCRWFIKDVGEALNER